MYLHQLTSLGVLSETSALIDYLVKGFVEGLKLRVPDSVNLYPSDVFRGIVTSGVTAAVSVAAPSSSNTLIPRDLLSQLMLRFRDQYPFGNPYADAFNYAIRTSSERTNDIRHLNLISEAIWILIGELLARWVPPEQAQTSGSGTTINVDTVGAQTIVAQNLPAGTVVDSGKSFLESYGIYVAAALLLLLILDKGK